jgi:predicted Zn finger-like uncharacterized protein
MLLSCPSCGTRFLVNPAALGANGRKVRCGGCAHEWFQEPPETLPPDGDIASPHSAEAWPGAAQNLPAPGESSPSAGATAILAVLLVLLAIAVASAYLGRQLIMREWPRSVVLYESIENATGLPLLVPGRNLTIVGIAASREARDGHPILIVDGTILNLSGRAAMVPRLRLTLLDAGGTDVGGAIFRAPKQRLLPGETLPFRTIIAAPPVGAVDVTIDFVTKEDVAT